MLKAVKKIIVSEIHYLILKTKWRKKVIFDRSNYIGMDAQFEGANKLAPYASFEGSLGYGSYIANRSVIDGCIGRFCSIGPDVNVNRGIHPLFTNFATLSPMFYSTSALETGITFAKKQMFLERKPPIKIGNDCWIGQGVFFAGGVSVGDGAVVLAGATVVSDIPPYAVVGGAPAKVIRYRYDDETIKYLLRVKWWNRDISWLRNNWELLTDIERLKKEIQ